MTVCHLANAFNTRVYQYADAQVNWYIDVLTYKLMNIDLKKTITNQLNKKMQIFSSHNIQAIPNYKITALFWMSFAVHE